MSVIRLSINGKSGGMVELTARVGPTTFVGTFDERCLGGRPILDYDIGFRGDDLIIIVNGNIVRCAPLVPELPAAPRGVPEVHLAAVMSGDGLRIAEDPLLAEMLPNAVPVEAALGAPIEHLVVRGVPWDLPVDMVASIVSQMDSLRSIAFEVSDLIGDCARLFAMGAPRGLRMVRVSFAEGDRGEAGIAEALALELAQTALANPQLELISVSPAIHEIAKARGNISDGRMRCCA